MAVSVALFAVLFFVVTTASKNIVNTTSDVETLLPWINAVVYLLYVIAGFVAGMVAKRRLIANGLIAGVLASVTAILVFGVTQGDAFGNAASVITGGVLGGIGGAFSMLLAQQKKKTD